MKRYINIAFAVCGLLVVTATIVGWMSGQALVGCGVAILLTDMAERRLA